MTNIPTDLEYTLDQLVQESGRAGRDGNQAKATIFYSARDLLTNMAIIANSKGRYVITKYTCLCIIITY
jgi:superfamily II DNA helicase RecQ